MRRRAVAIARGGAAVLLVAGAMLALARLVPARPLREAATYSTAVYAEGGELLRLSLAADDRYRLWAPLDGMSPAVRDAVLLYEDRWFWWHPGVNPMALARSAAATYMGGRRQGGSTVTMQLARRLYLLDTRSVRGKLAQVACAVWLEARHGKREILEAHLNLAPFGGNVEGVGTASLVFFDKRAAALTLPEALTLAVIPQNPRGRVAWGRADSAEARPELLAARARLWRAWLRQRPGDRRLAADLGLGLALRAPAGLPFRAPHLAEAMLRPRDGAGREVWTTLDLRLQSTVERMIQQHVEAGRGAGIDNATAILVETPTMAVRAFVGSADFFDASIDGQVNGVFARRSPGSTLKPFIYALALDQGLIHPMTILKDLPTAFGPFSPENFDGRFAGPLPAQDALIRSRNVPAVWLTSRLAGPSLHDLLREAGVARLAPEAHYGLALALGGGDLTMEELARLYAMLANRGVLRPLRYTRDAAVPAEGVRLLSDEAAFIAVDMLRRTPRPDTGEPAARPVAWKTGTSWAFRDAWTAGIFGRYALVVWVGDFDGRSNPAYLGVSAAAPLFFKIVDAVRGQGLDPGEPVRTTPSRLARVSVCAASGDLPNEDCRDRVETWFIPGRSPIRVSTLHRAVLVDGRTGAVACAPGADTRRQVFEFWPSDVLRGFRDAGMPRREPPVGACGDGGGAGAGVDAAVGSDGDGPRIVSPLRAAVYTVRLARPAAVELRATCTACGALYWFAGDGLLGRARAGEALAWAPAGAGRYTIRVVDAAGRADVREVVVELGP